LPRRHKKQQSLKAAYREKTKKFKPLITRENKKNPKKNKKSRIRLKRDLTEKRKKVNVIFLWIPL